MKLSLYLAYLGFVGIWFSSGNDQLEQPKKYLDYLINNSFLKYLLPKAADKLKLSVRFKNRGELRLNNLTELNARSSRADFIVYDEEAQADTDAYRAGVNILAGSELGMILHISTPVKATIFEENYERLYKREVLNDIRCVFTRSWNEVAFLEKNREWYLEQKRILPGWYYRQEHECSFELPSGAIFKNVIYEPYPEWLIEAMKDKQDVSGVDWNPAAGHTKVTVRYLKEHNALVVTDEAILFYGYTHELKNKEFNALVPWFTHGKCIVLEDGGINIGYIKWFNEHLSTCGVRGQDYSTEEWDNQGVNKMEACTFIIQNGITIYVDRQRFPHVAKQIEDCHWDEEALEEPKIAKVKANSPHYLDGFLHTLRRIDSTANISFGDWY